MLLHSTEIVLDTCTVFNLINANVLELVCELPFKFYIGPIVHGECTKQPCPELEAQILKGNIVVLNGALLPVSVFSALLTKYNLGDGETECIGYAITLGYNVCTDDGKARDSVKAELTTDFLIGSIGLLKMATDKILMTCKQAFAGYEAMKSKGAFLPILDAHFFCLAKR